MKKEILRDELKFKAVRSSGSGGQNVNKVSTKIELHFDLLNSSALSENEKLRIQKKLENRINKLGIIILHCEESRSQHKNKELAIKKLFDLLEKALKRKKKRIKTKIPKAAKQKRMDSKSRVSQKKANRKKPDVNL